MSKMSRLCPLKADTRADKLRLRTAWTITGSSAVHDRRIRFTKNVPNSSSFLMLGHHLSVRVWPVKIHWATVDGNSRRLCDLNATRRDNWRRALWRYWHTAVRSSRSS